MLNILYTRTRCIVALVVLSLYVHECGPGLNRDELLVLSSKFRLTMCPLWGIGHSTDHSNGHAYVKRPPRQLGETYISLCQMAVRLMSSETSAPNRKGGHENVDLCVIQERRE